jgi:hypothetical protein
MAHLSNSALGAAALVFTALIAVVFGLSLLPSFFVFVLFWPSLSLLRSRFRWIEMMRGNPEFLTLQSEEDEVNTGRIWHLYLAHKRYAEKVMRDGRDRSSP